MKFYEYIHRDSLVHKLDPRTKLLWLVFLSAIVFVVSNPRTVIAILIFTLLIGFLAKLPFRQVWDTTKIFVILMPPAFILTYCFLIGFSANAVFGGLVFSAKFLVLIFAAIFFTMTTSARDLIIGLVKLKIPYSFAFMLTIAIRFVPVIAKEINNVIDAQRARAYEFTISLKHPVKTAENFIPILIPVLMLLLKRSYELSLSIDSRAFGAKKKFTSLKKLKLHLRDYMSLLIMIAIAVIIR